MNTVLDSSGKFPPSGLLEGTLTDLGRWDECLAVDETLEGSPHQVIMGSTAVETLPGNTRIQGQYCSLLIQPPLPPRPRFHTLCNKISALLNVSSSESNTFRWLGRHAQYFFYSPIRIGVCSPSQCSPQDVHNMISKMTSSINMTATVSGTMCDVRNNLPSSSLNWTQAFILLVFSLLVSVILAATILDVMSTSKSGTSSSSSAGTSSWKLPPSSSEVVVSSSCPPPLDEFTHQQLQQMIARHEGVYYDSSDHSSMHWVQHPAPGNGAVEDLASNSSLGSSSYSGNNCSSSCDTDSVSSGSGRSEEGIDDHHQWIRILKCFSLRTNASQILDLDSKSGGSNSSLGVIHGLRVLTMGWIIMGHTYGLVNPTIHSNVFSAEDMYTKFLYQGLLNATLSVDTFFFISGLLTVYVSWNKFSASKSIPAFTFIILRYLRLTPPYLAVIGVAFIFPLLSSGPLWRETVVPISSSCYESWWTNLLYVNNFVKADKLCLMHSWYLSNDMQMHLFAILFLTMLLKCKLMAFLLLSSSMVACTTYSFLQTLVNDYPPTIVSTSPVVEDRWNYILDYYYKPWPHLPSYCIGLGLGYFLAAKSVVRLTIRQKQVTGMGVFVTATVVLYGVYPWNMGWEVPAEVTAIYSSTFRTLWVACCAWITHILLTECKESLPAQVLSWKGLLPFSRLTYMAFLTHPFVIWFYSGSLRERFTANHFNYFHLFLGHYLLTYLVAFVFGLCFESPFMCLIKMLTDSKCKDTLLPKGGQRNRTRKSKESHLTEETDTLKTPLDVNMYNLHDSNPPSRCDATHITTALVANNVPPASIFFDTNTV